MSQVGTNQVALLNSQLLVRIPVVVIMMRGINRGCLTVSSRDLAHNSNKIDSNSRGKLLRNNNRGPNPPSKNNSARDKDEKRKWEEPSPSNIANTQLISSVTRSSRNGSSRWAVKTTSLVLKLFTQINKRAAWKEQLCKLSQMVMLRSNSTPVKLEA